MKKMRRIAGLMLAFVLVLSLCACGGNSAKALFGTWSYELDYTNIIEDMVPAEMQEMLPDEKLVMPLLLTFNEDMTVVASVDTEVVERSLDIYLDALIDSLVEMMYKEAENSGINRDDFDALVEEAYGMGLAEYCEAIMEESVDIDMILDDLDMEESAGWKVEGGKLYVDENGTGFDAECYVEYTISGGKMTFTAEKGDAMGLKDLGDELGFGYPMVWEKR